VEGAEELSSVNGWTLSVFVMNESKECPSYSIIFWSFTSGESEELVSEFCELLLREIESFLILLLRKYSSPSSSPSTSSMGNSVISVMIGPTVVRIGISDIVVVIVMGNVVTAFGMPSCEKLNVEFIDVGITKTELVVLVGWPSVSRLVVIEVAIVVIGVFCIDFMAPGCMALARAVVVGWLANSVLLLELESSSLMGVSIKVPTTGPSFWKFVGYMAGVVAN
jgi:tRNA-binding EMAP/Myf-like protein